MILGVRTALYGVLPEVKCTDDECGQEKKKKSLMHPCEFQPKWISPCSYLSVCCPPALGSRWRESQQVWEIGNPLSQRCAGRKYEMSMSFVIMELGIALSNSLCHRQMGKIKNGG